MVNVVELLSKQTAKTQWQRHPSSSNRKFVFLSGLRTLRPFGILKSHWETRAISDSDVLTRVRIRAQTGNYQSKRDLLPFDSGTPDTAVSQGNQMIKNCGICEGTLFSHFRFLNFTTFHMAPKKSNWR